ncbi:TetR/AcrR family transcriptional regulator [Sphingomonas sp. TX0543]|uniref:TetR/AcrR family transcriptional regulator n=1 Tax=unclassified Sphingomonas TaxID=196159 RepID=UPI0010F61DA1|nr:TetR/AcrR family transcriptional regulator [Sphingomonas sp. 3P27F8]
MAAEDGRHKRSEASRRKIIAAMVALVGEGDPAPAAEKIAARAGVGLRTVFRQFADMEAIYAGMAERLADEYRNWLDPFTATDWRGQLAEMIERRLETYERLMPYKRAADAHRHASATIQQRHAVVVATMRARLQGLLPPAIAGDEIGLETIDLMLSFETWQRLRLDQGLPVPRARMVVESAVARVLASHQEEPAA